MESKKIYDKNGRGFTRIFSDDIVESVNPVEYYKTYELEKRAILIQDQLHAKSPIMTSFLGDKFFKNKAREKLVGYFEKFEATKVHDNFLQLLETTRKQDQTRLLKGMTLNTDELMSLIFKYYNKLGLLYSKYKFENLPDGLEGKKLPRVFQLKEDGTVEKIGKTDLTDGELKNVIEQRKVIVSHFFEKDDFWHCLFLTYNSIRGKENHKDGQAHFHYISSSFNITKADFIESMRTGRYKSTSIHVDLLDYPA